MGRPRPGGFPTPMRLLSFKPFFQNPAWSPHGSSSHLSLASGWLSVWLGVGDQAQMAWPVWASAVSAVKQRLEGDT